MIARRSRAGVMPAPLPRSDVPRRVVAWLVPLDPGLYAFRLAIESRRRDPAAELALPSVHVCAAPPLEDAIEITDGFGRAGSWLDVRNAVLFVNSPAGGGAALVTGYLAGEPDRPPLELEIRRIAAPGPAAPAAPMTLTLTLGGGFGAAEEEPQSLGLEIVAHIRDRGDV